MTAARVLVSVRFSRAGVVAGRAHLAAYTRELLTCAAEELRAAPCEISVLYCSEREMHRLNHEFLGVDRPTDVLSFPAGGDVSTPESDARHLGDLALCLPYAARQARREGRKLEDEVALLLVHGLLHLLGHDHDNAASKRRMWKLQADILRAAPKLPSRKVKVQSSPRP